MKSLVLLALICGFSMPGLAVDGVKVKSADMTHLGDDHGIDYLMVPIATSSENYIWPDKKTKTPRFLKEGQNTLKRNRQTGKREKILVIDKMYAKFDLRKQESQKKNKQVGGFYFQKTESQKNPILVMLDQSRTLTKDSLLALVKRTIHAIVITREDPKATIAIVIPSLHDGQISFGSISEQITHLQKGLNEYILKEEMVANVSILMDSSYGNKIELEQIVEEVNMFSSGYYSDCDLNSCDSSGGIKMKPQQQHFADDKEEKTSFEAFKGSKSTSTFKHKATNPSSDESEHEEELSHKDSELNVTATTNSLYFRATKNSKNPIKLKVQIGSKMIKKYPRSKDVTIAQFRQEIALEASKISGFNLDDFHFSWSFNKKSNGERTTKILHEDATLNTLIGFSYSPENCTLGLRKKSVQKAIRPVPKQKKQANIRIEFIDDEGQTMAKPITLSFINEVPIENMNFADVRRRLCKQLNVDSMLGTFQWQNQAIYEEDTTLAFHNFPKNWRGA